MPPSLMLPWRLISPKLTTALVGSRLNDTARAAAAPVSERLIGEAMRIGWLEKLIRLWLAAELTIVPMSVSGLVLLGSMARWLFSCIGDEIRLTAPETPREKIVAVPPPFSKIRFPAPEAVMLVVTV